MIESISKQKIPSNYSYVLKTGQLEKLLAENDININVDLSFSFSATFFTAYFWLPNNRVPYRRVYIYAGVLPKEEVHIAREKLEQIVLPEFAIWIKGIMSLPDNSTKLKHNLCFDTEFNDNEAIISFF